MNPAPSRLESSAFYVILATVVLAPLAFWPSPYAALELAKTFIIAAGTLISAILLGITAMKQKKMVLPPRAITWTAALLSVSIAVSALVSGHIEKSFFGQGFEAGTASLILVLFLAAYAVFVATRKQPGRVVVLYTGLVASFLILYVFHFLRLLLGPDFASFSILNAVTSTVLGSWYALAAYSLVVAVISVSALTFLSLSRSLKVLYWVLIALSAIGAYIVNDGRVWAAATLVFFGLMVFMSMKRPKSAGGFMGSMKRIAWIPLVACIIAGLFTWKGAVIAGPAISKLNAGYSELVLPWQMTLDVASGSVKAHPLFGVGPNRFSQAYLDFKPAGVNSTDAWNVEFASGWSTISTFVVTQGFVGTILWILFFVFFGIAGVRALSRLPDDPRSRFVAVSSFSAASFLWIVGLLSTLPHALLFYAFIFTGIFFASAADAREIVPAMGTRSYKLMPTAFAVLILVAVVWGAVYAKKTVALAYFASGIKQLTAGTSGNPDVADSDFAKAGKLDSSDIYWQARAEAGIARANMLGSTVNAQSPASSTQAVLTKVVSILNDSIGYAEQAIQLDPSNYYNYVSKARVAAAASSIGVTAGYDTAVKAYTDAINRNPQNPSLYLNLAQLQAASNKTDDALKTVGAALQVKNNYLDAIFLLSQVEAAKGNLADAITAAQVATQINPQSPVLSFQLGLLQYENKNYDAAAQALGQAVKLQPNYANAQYFLGLAQARLGKTSDAISQFQTLAVSNPDNQEVSLILTNLRAGKSPFTDAKPPVTTAPEKRSSLPIKQR